MGLNKYNNFFNINDRFGKYTIVDVTIVRNNYKATILVKCDCGNIQYVDVYSLINNKTTRCFKCNTRNLENNAQWKGYKTIPGKVISKLKRDALRRNINVYITLEDIYDCILLQNNKCALTGIDIDFINLRNASVDRINSSKDYTVDNIQIVHKDINIMKNAFDQEYFMYMCKLVTENNSKKY